jgi:hypothetical protein
MLRKKYFSLGLNVCQNLVSEDDTWSRLALQQNIPPAIKNIQPIPGALIIR